MAEVNNNNPTDYCCGGLHNDHLGGDLHNDHTLIFKFTYGNI